VGVLDAAKLINDFKAPDATQMEIDADKKSLDEMIVIKQNIQEIYMVFYLDGGKPEPFYVVKLPAGGDAKKAFALLEKQDLTKPVTQEEFDKRALVKDNNTLIIGNERALLRLKAPTPATVPNLEKGFTLAGDGVVQVVYVPTDNARANIAALIGFATQGQQLGFDPKAMFNSVTYAAISARQLPSYELRFEVQATDPTAAANLRTALSNMLDQVRQTPGAPPDVVNAIASLLPAHNNDKLSLNLNQDSPIFQLVRTQAAEQRRIARRAQVINNLKEIALAMQNYQSANGKLPLAKPAAGGPGLSWRVHLLPYLEHKELYDQFKLNEPWDSPSNKPLVEKMPKIYSNPTLSLVPGMTTYCVPIGENTAFPPGKQLALTDITDGTSNTMMVLDVDAGSAVVWTKPDDWEMDPVYITKGIGNNYRGIFLAALCDGSAKAVKTDVDSVKRLVLRNDGQPIDPARAFADGPSVGLPFPLPLGGPPRDPRLAGSDPRVPPGFPMPPGPGPGDRPPPGPLPPGYPDPRNPNPGVPNPNNPNPGIPGDPNASQDPPYIAEAKKALAAGHDNDAYQFIIAEAIAGEDKDNLKSSLKLAKAWPKSTLALRWGIGIEYNPPRNLPVGPTPIGKPNQAPPQPATGNNQQTGDPNAPKSDTPPLTAIDYYTGELGQKLLEKLKTRIEVGQFGEVLKTFSAPSNTAIPNAGYPQGGVNLNPNVPKPISAFKPQGVSPGIVYLGVDKLAGLQNRAKQEGLDGLVVFDVDVTASRTAVVNTTKMSVFNLNKKEPVYVSKQLKNIQVEKDRKEGKGSTDPVDDTFEKMFAAIDNVFKLDDVPETLSKESITAYVMKQVDAAPQHKLPLVLEIMFYQEKGLISPEDAKVAFEKLLGAEGAGITGTPAERKAAIDKLLPKGGVGLGGGKRIGS
jgi:hypothetical protein